MGATVEQRTVAFGTVASTLPHARGASCQPPEWLTRNRVELASRPALPLFASASNPTDLLWHSVRLLKNLRRHYISVALSVHVSLWANTHPHGRIFTFCRQELGC